MRKVQGNRFVRFAHSGFEGLKWAFYTCSEKVWTCLYGVAGMAGRSKPFLFAC